MKLFSYIPIIFFLMGGIAPYACAQDTSLEKADHAFRHLDYQRALDLYDTSSLINENAAALEQRGICNFKLNNISSAIKDFTNSKKLGNNNPDLFWYMAKSNQLLSFWDEAAFFYKEYILHSNENASNYIKAHKELKNCLYRAELIGESNENASLVQAFGDKQNSAFDEITPVLSPSYGNVFYYSSNNGKNGFKIRACTLDSAGVWSTINTDDQIFNKNKNVIIQDISDNGQSLLFCKMNKNGSKKEYLFSTLSQSGKEITISLDNSVFREAIDLQLVNNNTIAFASKELNGYGGYDIYTINYINGNWSKPLNAGNLINTSNNERSPCFSSDKSQLYFSSDQAYSFGGYDIYSYIENSTPVNLGSTVNSSGDELHLKVDKDGHMGVFSSNRMSSSGAYDIYFLYLQDIRPMGKKDSMHFSYVLEALKNAPQSNMLDSGIAVKQEAEQIDSTILMEGESSLSDSILNLTHINNIFYEDSYDLKNRENRQKLKQIAEQLDTNNYHLVLLAHTDHSEPGLIEYRQYSCFKRAMTVAELLVEYGISPDRISIESVENNYPLVKNEVHEFIPDSLLRFNKRIDVFIYDITNKLINESLLDDWLEIPDYAKDKRFQLYKTIRDGLYFSVKIARSDRLYKNAVLRLYNDVYMRNENLSDENDYYIGIYTKLKDALSFVKQLSKTSINNPEIAVFKNGLLQDEKQIKQLSRKHRELNLLLK